MLVEYLTGAWAWLQANHASLAEGVLMLLMSLSILAKLTPTQADDKFIAKIDTAIRKALGLLGLQPSDKKKSS